MAIPAYLWLYEEEGNLIKGSVDLTGSEVSIECVEIQAFRFLDRVQNSIRRSRWLTGFTDKVRASYTAMVS